VWLAGGRFRHDDEGDLTGLQPLDAFAARQDAAPRREDARHTDEVAGRNAGRTQRELERGELFAVLADTLGEKHFFWN
jgi:hypothetical protein